MRSLVVSSLVAVVFTASAASAAVKTETVLYKLGSTELEGVLAYDDAKVGRQPAILLVHDWTGVGPNVKRRAEQLAGMGYVAFAADIYGKGVRPTTPEACGKEATKYKSDRPLLRARVNAGYDVLAKHARVDPTKIAAIGYCFGGTTVLELARSGTPVKGVVSFHGGLDSPKPEDGKNIKGKVLALHGADDPYVPAADKAAFEQELRAANVDWQLVEYGGAVHSFTIPEAGSDKSKGAAYDARADARSWEHMKLFLADTLK